MACFGSVERSAEPSWIRRSRCFRCCLLSVFLSFSLRHGPIPAGAGSPAPARCERRIPHDGQGARGQVAVHRGGGLFISAGGREFCWLGHAADAYGLVQIGFGNWGSVWVCRPKGESSADQLQDNKIAVKLVHRSKTSTTAARVRSLYVACVPGSCGHTLTKRST